MSALQKKKRGGRGCKIKCAQYQSLTWGPKIQLVLSYNVVHLADSKKEVLRTEVSALKWWDQLAI